MNIVVFLDLSRGIRLRGSTGQICAQNDSQTGCLNVESTGTPVQLYNGALTITFDNL